MLSPRFADSSQPAMLTVASPSQIITERKLSSVIGMRADSLTSICSEVKYLHFAIRRLVYPSWLSTLPLLSAEGDGVRRDTSIALSI